MRVTRIALAALLAAMTVTAAQSSVEPAPVEGEPVKGWTAIAGMSGPDVLELAKTLPVATDAEGDQPWCDRAQVVGSSLKAEFEERMVTRRADGTQLWGSDMMGTWTVILDRRDNTQCVIASGIGYQDGADPGAFYAKVGLS